jgi:hypothetical protein
LKLALEALEGLIKKTSGQAIYSFMETERRIAISACVGIKEALAQPEQPSNQLDDINVADIPKIGCVNHDCDKCKAQPEQEPVAVKHMMEWVDYLKRKSDYGQYLQIPSEMSAGACWDLARELEQFITTPPQRTWVGLTDEEKQQCIYDEQGYVLDYEDCVDKTEAKLKDKNSG